MQTKELPHDLLAEKSLLGCFLIDGGSFDEVVDVGLDAPDFYHPQYSIIFETIRELVHEHRPVDFVTICSRLKEKGKLDSLGTGDERGQNFILNIIEDQASAAHVYHYARSIKEKSTLRSIVKMAQKVVETGTQFYGNTEEFISEVESDFFKLTQEGRAGGIQKLSHFLKDNLKELGKDSSQQDQRGILTGFKVLDDKLLGLRPGQLVLIASRPGMGKTSFALTLGINSVRNAKAPVAVFSLEMLAQELSMRILSSEAKVSSTKLRSKSFNDMDLRNIAQAVQRLSDYPIFINDSGVTTIFDIQSECRKIKAESGLGMIIIDYVQLMKPHSKNPSREQQIAEISRGLKQLAKELEVPVIALSQLNRGVEARTDKRPMVSDLRESGALEQDADVVLLLYRDDFYYPDSAEKGVAEVIVGKNRAGETGTAKLAWLGPYTSFSNLSFQQNDDFDL